MANDYDTTARDALMDHFATLATRIAAHTGDPGGANSATNEVAGGSYARQAITWAAASGGAVVASSDPVIPIPAATSVSWLSFWNATGTVRYSKKALGATEVFGAAGTLTVTDATFDLNDA